MKAHHFLLLAAAASTLHAGPRFSANYEITTDSTDLGGHSAASANFTHDGSAGEVVGVSAIAIPATATKHGFVGQLSEWAGFALTAAAPTVDEGGTVQLAAWQSLDDASLLAVPGTAVTWSVQSGSLADVDATGLASASLVYQDTPAVAQGMYRGTSASLALTVVNITADDFGLYAGDGIADDWQVQYFGEGNPAALANADPDGDGQNNRFEFAAGLAPTDPHSAFQLRITPLAGPPGKTQLVFSPRLNGRSYQIQYRSSLTSGAWTPLLDATQSDDGTERTVTDPNATGSARFYRIEITKP